MFEIELLALNNVQWFICLLLAYGLFKETVTVIIMLYKNINVMVRSPNSNTDFFHIIAGVLHHFYI